LPVHGVLHHQRYPGLDGRFSAGSSTRSAEREPANFAADSARPDAHCHAISTRAGLIAKPSDAQAYSAPSAGLLALTQG